MTASENRPAKTLGSIVENGFEEEIRDDLETGGKIITLLHPVSVGDGEVSELVLKRPKLKHLRDMDRVKGGDMDKVGHLIVALSGHPAGVVDAFDAEDVTRITKVLEDFFGPLLGTGAT